MRHTWSAGLLVLATVAGCVGTAPPPSARSGAVEEAPPPAVHVCPAQPPRPCPPFEAEGLLAYYVMLQRLQSAELAKEYDAVQPLYAKSRTDANRVRLAMLLGMPGTAFNDHGRALETLDPLLRNPSAPLHGVGVMLGAQIQEQKRTQGLQQKLDALRQLDKDLLERESTGGRKR